MFIHCRRLMTASIVAASVIAAGSAAAFAAPQAAPAVAGTEHIQIMSASPGGPATVIASGAVNAAGIARIGSGKVGTLRLQGGTLTLSHSAGKGTAHFNPATCLTSVTQPGTFTILKGTGRYAGLHGHGTYKLSLLMLGARSHGTCSATKQPAGQQELLRLTGHVRL